jgi:hypothetical protein
MTAKDQGIELYADKFDIKWNDMILPINSELFDDWQLSRLPMFRHPEIVVPIRIMYVPDEEFDAYQRHNLETQYKPKKWQFWLWPRYWWWYYKTRAISYAGRIYIKQSAHKDRALLLHELGHTIPFLEHTWRPGAMNTFSPLWLTKKEHVR